MAYFAQKRMHGIQIASIYIPPKPPTRIVCDYCAEFEVPFMWEDQMYPGTTVWKGDERIRCHCKPWRWTRVYGAPCQRCGTKA